MIKLQLRGIDMSRETYSHIECGIDNIRVSELLALAEIFRVDVSEFFKGMRLQTDTTTMNKVVAILTAHR